MIDLKVDYLGLKLKNPLIVGACKYTANLEKLQQMQDAGAAAVVIKSIFEEEIQLERFKLAEELEQYDNLSPEMTTIFPQGLEHAGPAEHLMWTRKAKEALDIPVIGSVNAVTMETWLEYAVKMEETGIDALEINFYSVPTQSALSAAAIEAEQVAVAAEIVRRLKIPVTVKLSPYYTNPLSMVSQLEQAGVRGVVLFNRLFQPSIDIETETNIFPFNPSCPNDMRLPLRFTGLLFGETKCDLCSSTGVFSGQEAISTLLAGATCFQVVSALYAHGINHIGSILSDIEQWMDRKGYKSIDAFRGKLSRARSNDPWIYTRAQYASMLLRGEVLIKAL